jgi:hypothetical protein
MTARTIGVLAALALAFVAVMGLKSQRQPAFTTGSS